MVRLKIQMNLREVTHFFLGTNASRLQYFFHKFYCCFILIHTHKKKMSSDRKENGVSQNEITQFLRMFQIPAQVGGIFLNFLVPTAICQKNFK